ncbi:hypothetical protein DUI87_17331 [Hirundo rustica rustica]|uniref:Cell cycle checkpoint control protein RAD9B n=1 Tax=Hirundo rustica rustica TaxID=333673 RepID=A0A3M0JYF7_HIRRU|nr:hypothetical protein DUI87_17331 [Hirundo rustica rustica]
MKCVIGGAQLRVFGRAIHAIARISDEFWFDPVEKGDILINATGFSSVVTGHKSVLPVFRCANMLERNVEKCSISTKPSEQHITFQLLCRHDFSRTMLTEIQLSPEEFDYFQVGVDSEVTFCLKELRVKPIAFSIEDLLLEASFILATLCEAEKEAASPEPACCPRPRGSSRTGMDKSDHPSTDGARKADTAASKKPQQKGNTLSMGSAKPSSDSAKQEFHSLFFGAVSSKKKEAIGDTFQSLVTASDTEEEFGALQSSPVL